MSNGAKDDASHEEEEVVVVRGSCIDVPIYVEQEEYDLKTCIYDHIFRQHIVLHNHQSVAMKIQVKQPKEIHGELQLNPTLAYVQGHESQAIQVKFSPKLGFLEKRPNFRDAQRPETPGAFRIPVKIVGADQVLPVWTALVGVLTTNALSFTPPVLSFGLCFVGSAVQALLTITNESRLPQKYAFLRLPSFLSAHDLPSDVADEEEADAGLWGVGTAVLDGGGSGVVGTLMPFEKKRVCVTYTPESATEMDYSMVLKVITGSLCVRNFTIPCRGQGRTPVLSLTQTQINIASIPCHATAKESIEVFNKGSLPYTMNLVLPPTELTGLFACPACFTLRPKEKRRLQLEFKPDEHYVNLLQPPKREPTPVSEAGVDGETPTPPPPAEAATTPASGEEAVASSEEAAGPSPEEHRLHWGREVRRHGGRRWESAAELGQTVHAMWKVPIYLRAKPDKVEDDGKEAPHSTMYIGVRTCVLPAVFSVDPMVLDFGEVPAQQRRIIPLELNNRTPEIPQELRLEPLPENACFAVLNAPRTMHDKPFKFMVEFKPQYAQIYQSSLKIYTHNTRVQVPLRGKGVRLDGQGGSDKTAPQ